MEYGHRCPLLAFTVNADATPDGGCSGSSVVSTTWSCSSKHFTCAVMFFNRALSSTVDFLVQMEVEPNEAP